MYVRLFLPLQPIYTYKIEAIIIQNVENIVNVKSYFVFLGKLRKFCKL